MRALIINMKFVVLSVALAALTLAASSNVELVEGITPKKLPSIEIPLDVLSTQEWTNLKTTVVSLGSELETESGHIEANVTDYALELLANVQKLIIQDGLDPLELSDQYINLIDLGYVNITDGWLQQLSTITLSGDVIAKYSMSTHILEITLPIAFDNLLISYDYHTQVLLLSIEGTVDAQVQNVTGDMLATILGNEIGSSFFHQWSRVFTSRFLPFVLPSSLLLL